MHHREQVLVHSAPEAINH